MSPESRTLTLAVGVSIALHAAALKLLDPAFRGAMTTLDATISVIEARLAPREPVIAEEPPAPAAPTAPSPVIKDTLAPAPPPKPVKAPPPRTAAPPPEPKPRPEPKPKPPPEPMAPQELGATYERLAETLLYPEEAVRRGLQGETVLLLEVGANGRIVAASVASSSGHPILDEAALRAVRLLGALGPASAGKAVLLPVRFQLE